MNLGSSLAAASDRAQVWIIDDSPVERQLAVRALEDRYRLRTFSDGPRALEALNEPPAPDMVVLDWQMPGLSGIEICQFLRSHEPTRALAVLMLTANDQPDDLVEGLSAGANDYITKPFRPEELRARVGALLRSDELRRRAEGAESSIRDLLLQLPEALLTVGADQRILFANHQAELILGQGRAPLVGSSLDEVLPQLLLNPTQQSSADQFSLPDVQLDGEFYAPAVRSFPGHHAAATTISLRRVTQQRRNQERRVDFYSIIAHDLRTPLQTMQLRAARMLRDEAAPLSASQRLDIDKLQASVAQMSELIDDFLDFARLDAAGVQLHLEEIDLAKVIARAVEQFLPMAEAKGITLRGEALGPAQVRGDRKRLAQVAANLISNAIKFTASGGAVTAKVARSEAQVTASVQDSGRGILAKDLDRLFHRYSRVDEEAATAVSGTGLGLMIVREIVEAHGGQVGVDSKEGFGSRFWFRLPSPDPA